MAGDDQWLFHMWETSGLKGNFCYYKSGQAIVSGFDDWSQVGSYNVFRGINMKMINNKERGINWGASGRLTRNDKKTITMY